PDTLQVALGEGAQLHPPIWLDAGVFDHAIDPRLDVGTGKAEQPREIREHFLDGEIVVVIRIFGEETDAPLDLEIARGTAENRGAAARRINQLHQQLEGCALAGAVGPEKAKYFSGLDAERQRVERAMRPWPPEASQEVLGQCLCLDRSRHAWLFTP